MTLSLALDIVLVALLAATIFYAVMLSRRLDALRRNKAELLNLTSSFTESTFRAEGSVQKLKKTAEEVGGVLQEQIAKGQGLRDDLAFLLERGDTLANRLEAAVRQARDEIKPVGAAIVEPMPRSVQATRPKPEAEAPPAAPKRKAVQPGADVQPRTSARPKPVAPEPDFEFEDEPRSESERALLRALLSAR